MIKNLLFLLLLLSVTLLSFGQTKKMHNATQKEYVRCYTVESEAERNANNPIVPTTDEFEGWMAQKIQELKNSGESQRITYTIPYIVHVVHNGTAVGVGDNILAAKINAQIQQLNDDFQRNNSDAGNTPATFLSVAGSIDINFKPALVNESNVLLAEPGINRINRNTKGWTAPPYATSYINSDIKPNSNWDPTKYFNIWVCDISGDILGYAQFPSNSGLIGIDASGGAANTDGCVLLASSVGSIANPGSTPPYNLGRTATHEIGHWLGLRHIWGDGNGCNLGTASVSCACANDDFCDDTPNHGRANYSCSVSNTCSSVDMKENFMDYSNDACMNLFTKNQVERMEVVLANSPRRNELLSSNVWQNPSNVVTASFTASDDMGCIPFLAAFTNTSSAGGDVDPLNSWEWNFDLTGVGGASPSTFSGENPPNVTFSTEDTYTIQLTVSNGTETDVFTTTINTTVNRAFNHLNGGDLILLGSGDWGYVSGHDDYLDQAKAEYFDDLPNGETLVSADFVFGKATGNPNTVVNFAVWDNDGPNGWPGTKLATTTKLLSEINVFGITSVDFDDVEIDGPVYIGIDGLVYSVVNQDTIALAMNSDGETVPTTAWEQWEDGDWYPFNDYTNTETTWEIDVSLAVYAIFECEEIMAPVAEFEADDLNVCTGVSVQFTDQSTNSPISWLWNFGDGTTSTMQNPTHTYATGGDKTVTLTATNGGGNDTETKAAYISVQQEPTGFQGNASVSTICNGESIDLSMSGTFGASYSWEINGNNIANGMNTTQSPAATTTYTAVCDNGVCRVTDDVTITVNALPAVPTITASGATLTANSGVATAWQWSDANGIIGGATSSTYDATVSGAYSVEITDANGCSSTSAVFNLSLSPPVADFSASATTICDGESIQFTDLSTNSPTSWSWNFGDGSAASTIQNPVHTYSTGTYTVTLTATNSFGDDIEIKTDLIIVNVIPGAPVVTEDGFSLTATGSGTFQWYLNGNAIVGATNATYVAGEDGNYTATVTLDGCTSALSNVATIANTAVIDKTFDAAISVYPNPVNNVLNISIKNNQSGKLTLSLVDVTGKIILTESSVKAETTIDMSNLSSGVYLLKFVNNDGKLAVKQIVKH